MIKKHFFVDDPKRENLLFGAPLDRAVAADGFRARFLDWAEPRGLDIPTTAGDLETWVERYAAATGDRDGMAEYLDRECPDHD